jgi:phosphoribosylanthranilate isomerase
MAKSYAKEADFIMLDTLGRPPSELLRGFIGGTGRTHDWALSREIVQAVSGPVILAGGLNLQNLVPAIEKVKPWGVDAASSLSIPGTGGKSDIDKVKKFVELAKGHS